MNRIKALIQKLLNPEPILRVVQTGHLWIIEEHTLFGFVDSNLGMYSSGLDAIKRATDELTAEGGGWLDFGGRRWRLK